LVAKIRAEHPAFMPTGLTTEAFLDLVPQHGAIVAFLFTERGSAIFVLPHKTGELSSEHVIYLNNFTVGSVRHLLLGSDEDQALGGWLGVYSSYRQSPRNVFLYNQWLDFLQQIGKDLWLNIVGPIHDRLKKFGLPSEASVLLMPQRGLGLLPLHAAWRVEMGSVRYFIDDWNVSYAPSGYAQAVSNNRLRDPRRQGRKCLVVCNPTLDLPFSHEEGITVAASFQQSSILCGNQATVRAVQNEVVGCQYIHFACHGFFDMQRPMQSGVMFASHEALKLYEIIASVDLTCCRLVVLSACETGITQIGKAPDEHVGLAAGFLQAGSSAVVSTLWAVNDLSTKLLMERFYAHLRDMPAGASLCAAQRWLRNMSKEESRAHRRAGVGTSINEQDLSHPQHWAAFMFSGA
jgi:CHAT domain-containing protein